MLAVRLCLLVTTEATPSSLPNMTVQMQCKQGDTNEHAKTDEEKPRRPQPYTKDYRQLMKAGSRRGIQCQMISTENIHASNIIQSRPLYLKTYMYTNI